MKIKVPRPVLKNKKALVVGIENEHSIVYAPKEDLQGGC
jgi:enoyl-[acyl-carrier-protein] reductase (NADH)